MDVLIAMFGEGKDLDSLSAASKRFSEYWV